MLNYGAPSWFYREITEFVKQTVAREFLLGQCCDDLFAIAKSVGSRVKESGSVAKLWASNIRFGYCTILTVCKNAHNNKNLFACLYLLL